MKKLIAVALVALLALTMIACRRKPNQVASTPQPSGAPDTTGNPAGSNAGGMRTGLAVLTTVTDSVSAHESDGRAKAESTIAAVMIDESGVITRCEIDAAQSDVTFSREGKLTTDPASVLETKQELGANYGMARVSGIGREWNEQVDALAAYVVGKTASDVRGISMTETATPADIDLATGCTISIAGFVNAIGKAADSADALGAMAGDRLGLAVSSHLRDSSDAAEGSDGVVQIDSTYAVVTLDASNRITSCILDMSQARVGFDAQGRITSDLTAPVATKNELGAEYGMASVSGIGREWYEQAQAFAAYAVGKTAAEVRGITIDEKGRALDADLQAGVTIDVGGFIDVLAKAVANAR